jgi:hypothetical protein
MKTLQLYGHEIEVSPEAGRGILVDNWGDGYRLSFLEDCEMPEFAPFRLPSNQYSDVRYACRVEITGRSLQNRPHHKSTLFVRVRIVFVGDGEPDNVATGWMAV